MAEQDDDFMDDMHSLLHMDAKAVKVLIGRMDADSLTALTDAVTAGDQEAAESIVTSFDTDEDVNPLFRGKDLKGTDDDADKKKLKRADDDHQFAYGDSVFIMRRDEQGKKKFIGATVYKPVAPHKTVGIKIDGTPEMIDHNMVYIEEGVLGMVGVPNLQRIQQLAGMAPAGTDTIHVEQIPQVVDGNDDCAVTQAMGALDALEQALPNVRLADLKAIRQRLMTIQQCMNESAPPGGLGRARKV